MVGVGAAAAAALFCKKDEILLLEEYANFADEAHMHRNKWVEFRKRSGVSEKYNARQIAKKIRRLQTKFEKWKIGASPPRDVHQARVLELSKSLWGIAVSDHRRIKRFDKPINKLHSRSRSPLKKKRRKKKLPDVESKSKQQQLEINQDELQLFYESLLIQMQVCEAIIKEEEKKIDVSTAAFDQCFNDDDNLIVAEKCDSQSNNKQICQRKKKKKKLQGNVKTLPSGLVMEELAKGDPNGKSASPGVKVKLQFIGKLKDSGHVVECSGKSCRIISLGCEEMIDGFAIGVDGMRVGGKRKLTIPPSLGFGEEGFVGVVPPNSWLEYEIELVDVCN